MGKIRLFVSQPMRDRRREEIKTEREAIVGEFKRRHPNDEVVLIKSYDPQLQGHPPVYALGFSLQMLAQADYAIFAPNWETARGCRIEHQACLDYDIDHLDLSDHYGKD